LRKPENKGKTPEDFDAHWSGLPKEARKVLCNVFSCLIYLTKLQAAEKIAKENNTAAKAKAKGKGKVRRDLVLHRTALIQSWFLKAPM